MTNTITVSLDENVDHLGDCVLLTNLIRSLRSSEETSREVNLEELALDLSNLNSRMTKAIMEIIVHYKESNPEVYTVMGAKNSAPYGGKYDKTDNSTSFDVKQLPKSLIMILDEFSKMQKRAANKRIMAKEG